MKDEQIAFWDTKMRLFFGTIFLIFAGIIFQAYREQAVISEKYKTGFNDFRKSRGIYPFTQYADSTVDSWDNYSGWELFYSILTNDELELRARFSNDSIDNRPYLWFKAIYFHSQTAFWNNEFYGESNHFLNPQNKDFTIKLNVDYIFETDDFDCRLDTSFHKHPLARPAVFEIRGDWQEISKAEADEILRDWGLLK